MTEADLKKYRRILLALARRLNGETESLTDEALRPAGAGGEAESINGPADVGDQSVDDETQDISLELFGNERLILAQVADALKRIDDGTYGRCSVCGRAIRPERLKAIPYTTLCLRDARVAEKGDVPASGRSSAPPSETA